MGKTDDEIETRTLHDAQTTADGVLRDHRQRAEILKHHSDVVGRQFGMKDPGDAPPGYAEWLVEREPKGAL